MHLSYELLVNIVSCPKCIFSYEMSSVCLFDWLIFCTFLQINESSESVTKPTDVLSKTNGSEVANKEGKH
jgi:hypothetical protein